jgi:NADPH-dependent 2,4-dienoyl-CoA reductase/sulfur reductase-like enzyme
LIKNEKNLLPKNVDWMINSVGSFYPEKNSLTLKNVEGKEEDMLTYDYLVIATGIELRYDLVS